MELIVLSRRRRIQRALHLGPLAVTLLGVAMLAVVAGAWWVGQRSVPVVAEPELDPRPALVVASMRKLANEQRLEVERAKAEARRDVDALAQQIAELQARAIRVDALGARLVDMVGLDPEEFSFDKTPGQGGPAPNAFGPSNDLPDLSNALEQLSARLVSRNQELEILERALLDAKVAEQMHPHGRPVSIGWTSSNFGWRRDPVTGQRSFHEGMDFAGKPGSPIFAVAAGIVRFAGVRTGFGNTVEIDHGRGFVTRYAHNRKNLVTRGTRVKKGQKIATMGASGRATGTHLHFEVLENGKPLNPYQFIRRSAGKQDDADPPSG